MLLTITNTRQPATDLGFLLHKNPARVQTFDLTFGRAHVFYTEATDARCTAALLLDVDPVGLVRGKPGSADSAGGAANQSLGQYVNDRPYVASSFLSVAISQVFGSALGGRGKDRAELIDSPLPLEARISVVPCRGGESFLRRLFEPLGYEVAAEHHTLDERFPEWGESPYYTVALRARTPLRDLLSHIYVLVPVLDNEKHYWVGEAEVDKLLRHGEGWLRDHPEREEIARRYLKHRRTLAREVISRLTDTTDADGADDAHATEEETVERPLSLGEQRLNSVVAALKSANARRVIDLGCGEGKLLRLLFADKTFDEIVGYDVSHRALEIARERLHLDRLPERQTSRLRLIHGSLNYRDRRLEGYDAAAVVEVIEHLDQARLAAFERTLFEFARPASVVLTTPNAEYNVRFETLPAGKFRHKDHRFEWTRGEFRSWAEQVAERFGYAVRFLPVGEEDAEVGAPTQMGVFTLGRTE